MDYQETLLSIMVETPQKMFVWAILRKFGGLKREQFNQPAHDKNLTRSEFVERLMEEGLITMTRRKTGATEEVGVGQDALEDIIRGRLITVADTTIQAQGHQRGHQEAEKGVEWRLATEQCLTPAQEQKL